jgi:hypothetical protein
LVCKWPITDPCRSTRSAVASHFLVDAQQAVLRDFVEALAERLGVERVGVFRAAGDLPGQARIVAPIE